MHSLSDFMRGRLPALALSLACLSGVAAVTDFGAPPALAQVKASKEFVEAYEAGKKAVASKDWSTVISSADKAAGLAKSGPEKLAVENLRMTGYSGLNKKAELLKVVETMMGMSGVGAEQMKNLKLMQMGLYSDQHNDAKAVELTKAYIAEYGGGTAEQNAFVASRALANKNYKDAIAYANKAIDIAKKNGKKPAEGWYQIVQKAYFEQKDNDNFYATVERTAAEYPKPETLAILIDRTTKEKNFNRTNNMLDLQRALMAAKAPLKPQEQADMGELAISRTNSAESAKIFEALAKTSFAGIDPAKTTRYKNMYAKAQADAKTDTATGFATREKDAAAAAKGDRYLQLGDAYLGAGDNAKAIEMIQKGIAKGNLDEGQIAFGKLDLGIAQLRAGKKDDARKTWADVKSDNGAAVLAKAYILMSK